MNDIEASSIDRRESTINGLIKEARTNEEAQEGKEADGKPNSEDKL